MAVVHTDLYRHENLVRKSIQIPLTQHKELKDLAAELESSLGDVLETIMDLMRQDNFQQVKSALVEKREREISSLNHSLDEAYAYLATLPETVEEAQSCLGCVCDSFFETVEEAQYSLNSVYEGIFA